MRCAINRSTMQRLKKLFTCFLTIIFLYATVIAPFAQANLWQERRTAVEKLKHRGLRSGVLGLAQKDATLLAQLPSLDLNAMSNAIPAARSELFRPETTFTSPTVPSPLLHSHFLQSFVTLVSLAKSLSFGGELFNASEDLWFSIFLISKESLFLMIMSGG